MGNDPERQIENLREGLEAGTRGGDAADRELLLEALANMELVPSEIGDHRR